MALTTKGTFTWVTCVIFLVFVSLRADGYFQWNWFYVFIPAYVYDLIMLLFITAQVVTEVKRRPTKRWAITVQRLWDMSAVVNKVLFQILLCIKLQAILTLNLFYVFIPLWLLFMQIALSLIYRIYLHERTVDAGVTGHRTL